jgi:tetratricopeptide (TPR) repeat protein
MLRQIKQKSQKQSNKSSSSLSEKLPDEVQQESSSFVSPLTDTDYEFLFDQLLEGIAHGWHRERIAKFFQQLGERGRQEQWLAWLNRYSTKILILSHGYEQQLAVRMMRLGELTQSTPSVKQIGRVAYEIGRQLFYGKDGTFVWEYDGLDLPEELPQETAIDLTEFNELDSSLEAIPQKQEQIQEVQSFTKETAQEIETQNNISSPQTNADDSLMESLLLQEEDTFAQELPLVSDSNSLDSITEETTDSSTSDQEEDTFAQELPLVSDSNSFDSITEEATDSSTSDQEEDTFAQELPLVSDSNSFDSITEEATDSSTSDQEEDTFAQNQALAIDGEKLSVPESSFLSSSDTTPSSSAKTIQENFDSLREERLNNLLKQDESFLREMSQQIDISSSDSEAQIQTLIEEINSLKTFRNPNSHKSSSSTSAFDETIQVQDISNSDFFNSYNLDDSVLQLVEGWFNLGLKQASAGDLSGALTSWEQTLKLNPHLSEAWHNRGSALGRLGKYEEAIGSFDRALEINPENYRAWNDRGHALYQLQKWEKALLSWNKAIAIMPEDYQLWYNRGCALEQLQRKEESIASYEKALEIKPEFKQARSRYINLLTDKS